MERSVGFSLCTMEGISARRMADDFLYGRDFCEAAGPFAGNAGSPAPAYTAVVDYFFNTASPVIPEDGS